MRLEASCFIYYYFASGRHTRISRSVRPLGEQSLSQVTLTIYALPSWWSRWTEPRTGCGVAVQIDGQKERPGGYMVPRICDFLSGNSQHSHHSWSEGRHGRRDRRWGRMDQIERWHRSSRERCWGRVLTWQPVWRWGYCPSLRWQHPAHPNGGCGSSWSESLGSDEWPGL